MHDRGFGPFPIIKDHKPKKNPTRAIIATRNVQLDDASMANSACDMNDPPGYDYMWQSLGTDSAVSSITAVFRRVHCLVTTLLRLAKNEAAILSGRGRMPGPKWYPVRAS